MKDEQFGMPVIGIVNSFTQFVPGHTHLHEIGQYVKTLIEERGCFAAEFNTIAIDDGIAMGHDGMLYSLPSREIIADSVEYMANAHQVDALFCISNCDKITPGMLMAAMRLNIPTIFVSGGPMEAGDFDGKGIDLIDAMVMSADSRCSDADIEKIERWACPGCGSCSGMFTANSMNCLNEALGLALPGNGTIVATHTNRRRLFEKAASLIVQMAGRYYFEGDDSVLPRNIATKAAFGNAMSLDIAMGGSTNTVLHLLAFALTGWAMQPARRAERMEREFLAAASHELKSPLAVIITSAELLPSGGEEAKYRANILSEAHRMAQLVQELLSLSRLETAARQIMPAKLDTEAFLWEVYETWQPVAAKAGDRLTLRLPDGALPPIRADEDALKQVMAILLSNAVQHTPSGTQIELSAVAAGRTVCLSVADTGPGIADKERAFQKFYRADPQTGDASLGLGLSIAQKLVALHHGSITIRDTPGGGATLQVTIPQA